jgi:hypothetical protein
VERFNLMMLRELEVRNPVAHEDVKQVFSFGDLTR